MDQNLFQFRAVFTVRNSSCGKVMFSQAYVKNSVRGGGCVFQHALGRGSVCPVGICLGYVCPEGCLAGGCWPKRGVSAQGVYTPWDQRQTPPQTRGRHPQDGHCSGQYASYWIAFLFFEIVRKKFAPPTSGRLLLWEILDQPLCFTMYTRRVQDIGMYVSVNVPMISLVLESMR